MNATTLLTIAVVVLGGMLLSTQGPINANLGRMVGDPIAAAMISFGVGLIILMAATFARGAVPSNTTLVALPWWVWLGGALGSYYVFAILWAVPRVGVLTVATATILGQLVMAMVLDAIGAFGVTVQPISWQRLAGVAMVLGGMVLTRV